MRRGAGETFRHGRISTSWVRDSGARSELEAGVVMALWPRTVIILLLALAAGCSRTELLYENADWLAGRWAGELMDASDQQQEAWHGRFRVAMSEHRRELLPELIVVLRRLESIVAGGPTTDALSCWLEAVEQVYSRHASWAVPPAADILLDISPQQLDHLAAELAERNQDYRDDYLDEDPQRRERDRIGRYAQRIEHWTGELSTEQLRLVEKAVRGMPDLTADWLAYRVQQQTRLLALLRSRVQRPVLQRFLREWWVELADRPAVLVDKTEQQRSGWVHLIVALAATLDAGQRAAVREQLADLRADLEGVQPDTTGVRLAWQDTTRCGTDAPQVR